MDKYVQLSAALSVRLSILVGLIFSTTLVMADDEYADISSRFEYFNIHYVVNDNLTHSIYYESARKILKERAIKSVKKFTTSYSTSIQDIEVLEAYTKKPDGKRIDAPKSNFQINTNSGKDKSGPVFSDRTSLTAVFPEVQVGDTVVFVHKIYQSEPMFPGHFTALNTFPTHLAYNEVNVTLDVPVSLNANYQIREMTEKISSRNGRKIYKWTYSNPRPRKNKRKNYSVWDPETYPGFSYSTFTSYKQIAMAYADRALPKAKVTETIQKLANDIVKDEKNLREKARLLYEWVAKNITYAGNCIGVGAVVPHDISFILDNRMGDCKDQATLLQALLSATGIQSIQALINSGNIYTLPKVPTVTAVNHVINYLPDYDMFVDATSESIPFGLLSFSVQDKPVLLVSNYKKNIKTYKSAGKSDTQTMVSIINIDEGGAATGNITVKLKGLNAASARRGFRNSTNDSEKEWLKKIFTNDGKVGFGSIIKDDPKELLDTFKYTVDFKMSNLIPLYGIGAFHVKPLLPSNSPINNYLYLPGENESVDVACRGGSTKEKYVYTLPDNIEIIATPDNADIKGKYIDYKSTYELDENTLTVSRSFNERTTRNICSPEFIKNERELIKKVIWDVKSQIVYKVTS